MEINTLEAGKRANSMGLAYGPVLKILQRDRENGLMEKDIGGYQELKC